MMSMRRSAGSVALVAALCVAAMNTGGCACNRIACERSTRLSKVVCVAVDVETTGLDPQTDRIVEIGVVKFLKGRKIGARSWLVNPGTPIPPSAVKIHGITTEMVGKSPGFAKVFPLFREFVGGAVILAHNARYDVAFLNAEIARAGMSAPDNRVLDTLPIFRQWFPKAQRHTLTYMVEYQQIESGVAHRGASDAASLFEVFKAGVAVRSPKLTLGDLMETAGGELHFVAEEP